MRMYHGTSLLVLALLLSTGAAYAVTSITTTTVIGGGNFTPSNNVTISVAANSNAYSAKSKHINGNRAFGTNNTDPRIHSIAAPVGEVVTTCLTATFDFSAWTPQQSVQQNVQPFSATPPSPNKGIMTRKKWMTSDKSEQNH